MGITMAVITGYIFRKRIFPTEITPSFQEMPAYHKPMLRNILFMTWFRLRSFIFKAGQAIIIVVTVLSLLNSIGTDGSLGNENTKNSLLSVVGKSITPAFEPIGIAEDNWPATVGLFTGMFAKEAVVGTLDALYSKNDTNKSASAPDLIAAANEALQSVLDAGNDLLSNLTDPLGINIGDVSDASLVADEQDVQLETLTNMAASFGTQLAAFSYLVFILLYAPCVAVLGAIVREAGLYWAGLVFGWSTSLAYFTAATIFQVGTFTEHPLYSTLVILTSLSVITLIIYQLKNIKIK